MIVRVGNERYLFPILRYRWKTRKVKSFQRILPCSRIAEYTIEFHDTHRSYRFEPTDLGSSTTPLTVLPDQPNISLLSQKNSLIGAFKIFC